MATANIDIVLGNGQRAGQTINELRQQANRLRKEINGLEVGSEEFVRATKDYQKVTKRLGTVRKEVRGVESSLKKAGGFFKQFGAQLTAAFGFAAIIQGIRQAVNIVREFQQANANLASVLGKTRSEIRALTDDARRLGSQTSFSASQVTELQTEFAKLGFTETEILNVTGATLRLAEATGTELNEAAAVTGATLRAFEMDSSQTQRVVDVMARSFSSSSLDMQKFSVAMAAVAPVAKTAGLDIERTTALIGLLADRGLDASTAGTSLRNMFLELSKRGITFEEAMEKVNSAVDKNAAALELFGTRGATTAVILAENAQAADDLEGKLNNSAGAAETMANEQLNTLNGQIKILQSSWEGFILSLEQGDGTLAKTAKSTISFITNAINGLTTLDTRFKMMFTSVTDLSREAKEQLLDLGITEAGNQVRDVINAAFEGLSNQEIIADFTKSKEIFISALEEEGEAAGDALALFRVFYRQRLALYQNDVRAREDALAAAREAQETEEAIARERAARQDEELQAGDEELPPDLLERLEATEQFFDFENLLIKDGEQALKDSYQEVLKANAAKNEQMVRASRELQESIREDELTATQATLSTYGNLFGNLAGFFEEGSQGYKDFASIQVALSTAAAAIEAYKSTAAIPIVGPALAPIAAAAATAFGLLQLRKVQQTDTKIRGSNDQETNSREKFQAGGLLRGRSHNQGGIPGIIRSTGQPIEMEGGEFVFSRRAVAGIGADVLAGINNKFQDGGLVRNPVNPLVSPIPGSRWDHIFHGAYAVTMEASGKSLNDDGRFYFRNDVNSTSDPGKNTEENAVVNAIHGLGTIIQQWPNQLKVNNNLQETREGIDTINKLEEEASF